LQKIDKMYAEGYRSFEDVICKITLYLYLLPSLLKSVVGLSYGGG